MRILASRLFKAPKIQPRTLWPRTTFFFSESHQDKTLMSDASLSIRNSQTFVLKLNTFEESTRKIDLLSFPLSTSATLNEIAEIFTNSFKANDVQFFCEKGLPISKYTPIEAMINRSFKIISPQAGYKIVVDGQLLAVKPDEDMEKAKIELKENLNQLELPVIAQREIQAYFHRVSYWLDAKYGPEFRNERLKLKEKEVQDILVQAILDPQCNWTTMSYLQSQWFKKLNEVKELRDKKTQALKLSEKMATTKMTLGLGAIAANIGFIWSGTYVFFSWDIIEPIAYFTSSLVSIVLFGQILKLKKPFSLENYREYLANLYLLAACQKIGLNLSELQSKERQLLIIESTIKDYLISKL